MASAAAKIAVVCLVVLFVGQSMMMTAAATTAATGATTCNCDTSGCYNCMLDVVTNWCKGRDFNWMVFTACLIKYSKENQCFSK
uniref:Gnk2-homologous domain-containing protein n=1 Tax=Oryza meridionalis TaxID=40149 RepID=A0A0E0EKT8_9ORYZ